MNCQIPLAKPQIQIIGGNGILEGVSANVVLRLSPVPRVFIDIKAELHSLVHFKIPTMPGEPPLKIRLPSGLEIEASITKPYLNGAIGQTWFSLNSQSQLSKLAISFNL